MKLSFKKNEFSEHIRLTLLAVLVGFAAGLASIAFKAIIKFFQDQLWMAPDIISTVTQPPVNRDLLTWTND